MRADQINTTSVPSFFIKQHSVMIRIWHWLTFIVISGIIITVLINSSIMNPRSNVSLVQDQLKSKGATVTEEQAFSVSHEYEDKFWGIHKLLGYGLAFLIFSRIIIEIAQPGEEKISIRIKNALRQTFGRNLGFSRELHGTIKEIHSLGQYLMYAFIAFHIGGVIIGENRKIRGVVSGMINGNI